MPDDLLRPEIVAALTRPRGLSSEQGGALLDATPAERAVAARLLHERSVELLQEAGVLPGSGRCSTSTSAPPPRWPASTAPSSEPGGRPGTRTCGSATC
jgi:hypothetical protein